MSIDRSPNGEIYKCSECERDYRGEAWMDYCAACHEMMDLKSPLRDRWACLTCSSTFQAGKLVSGPQGLMCPNCRSGDLTTAHGSREVPEYHGELGTKN
jgi:DNA-directed RNA polymerase subunit RPC12/RpoP